MNETNLKCFHFHLFQSTANGVRGANGMSAHEHVAEVCKQEAELLLSKKDTEENLVKEIHKKCRDATCKLAQVRKHLVI